MLTNNENFESANQLSLTSNIQQQPNDVHNDKRKIFFFNNYKAVNAVNKLNKLPLTQLILTKSFLSSNKDFNYNKNKLHRFIKEHDKQYKMLCKTSESKKFMKYFETFGR